MHKLRMRPVTYECTFGWTRGYRNLMATQQCNCRRYERQQGMAHAASQFRQFPGGLPGNAGFRGGSENRTHISLPSWPRATISSNKVAEMNRQARRYIAAVLLQPVTQLPSAAQQHVHSVSALLSAMAHDRATVTVSSIGMHSGCYEIIPFIPGRLLLSWFRTRTQRCRVEAHGR